MKSPEKNTFLYKMNYYFKGTPLTLLLSKISEAELNVERLQLLRLSPVYWREYRYIKWIFDIKLL